MKKASALDENLKEELLFAERTEKAFEKYKKGLFEHKTKKEFMQELREW